jgi:hypothetical protein
MKYFTLVLLLLGAIMFTGCESDGQGKPEVVYFKASRDTLYAGDNDLKTTKIFLKLSGDNLKIANQKIHYLYDKDYALVSNGTSSNYGRTDSTGVDSLTFIALQSDSISTATPRKITLQAQMDSYKSVTSTIDLYIKYPDEE